MNERALDPGRDDGYWKAMFAAAGADECTVCHRHYINDDPESRETWDEGDGFVICRDCLATVENRVVILGRLHEMHHDGGYAPGCHWCDCAREAAA